ncbi:MAG: M42 family metallopeptidase [Candidatus Aenigmarchaeota archaeon]|nr:M42 family metallopeptidase [Candidatus Aenigmarchaeota archaeon]
MVDTKLLEKLMEAYGISGSEEKVRAIIKKEIKPYVDEITVDNAGNLIAHQKGVKPTVMVAAHMDEIGLVVQNIDSDGNILFEKIGGIENLTLIGQRVLMRGKNRKMIQGVITTLELSEGMDIEELPAEDEFYIDTGLTKAELKKLGIRTGTFVSLIQENVTLGSKKIICGKALDDRVGCSILIEVIKKCKKISKNEMYFVFTVQEEMGLYGAKTSAFEIKPDWAIAIDVTNADDTLAEDATKTIGKGVTVTVKDESMIGNKVINAWLEKIGKRKKIPIQFDVSGAGTTDAVSIYLSRGGVPATVVGVPIRNMHSTVGIVHTDDIDNCVKLLIELFKKPPKKLFEKSLK